MLSFEENRPGTAQGYQICRVTQIKDQPPKSAGIQTAKLASRGGEPSILAFAMRGAPKPKPTFNTDDKQHAKTARSTAQNEQMEGSTSYNLFC